MDAFKTRRRKTVGHALKHLAEDLHNVIIHGRCRKESILHDTLKTLICDKIFKVMQL